MKDCGSLDLGSIPSGCTAVIHMLRVVRYLPIVYSLSLVSELGSIWWIFELISHWRVTYIIFGLLLLCVFSALRKWRSFFLVLSVLGIHLWWVAPYLHLTTRVSPQANNELSVVFANTYWLMEGQDKVITSMQEMNPDIIFFFEMLEPSFSVVKDGLPEYKYSGYVHGMYAFNIAYLSRVPVEEHVWYFVPLVPTLELKTQVNGQTVSIIGAHPHSPVDGEFVTFRNTVLRKLFLYAAEKEEPVLLGGDFNISPYAPEYDSLRKSFPMLRDSMEDFGMQNTWPTHIIPVFFSIPIDHAWSNDKLKVLERKTGPSTNSDHLPLFVRVGV